MIDGLWTVIFSYGQFAGGGVVYLDNGTAVGGDGQYFYLGGYSIDPVTRSFKVNLEVRAFVAGAVTVFGLPLPQFSLAVEGHLSGNAASARGSVLEYPSYQISMQLFRRWQKS